MVTAQAAAQQRVACGQLSAPIRKGDVSIRRKVPLRRALFYITILIILLAFTPALSISMMKAKFAPPRSSQGCKTSATAGVQSFSVTPGTTALRHIMVNGLNRTYRLHLPASYTGTSPIPIVLSHHGWTCKARYVSFFFFFFETIACISLPLPKPSHHKFSAPFPPPPAILIPSALSKSSHFLIQLFLLIFD